MRLSRCEGRGDQVANATVEKDDVARADGTGVAFDKNRLAKGPGEAGKNAYRIEAVV